MKTMYVIFIFLFFTFSLPANIINVPGDQPTIQTGIAAAVDADTVLVQPGVYVENIDFIGKNITVASIFLTTQDNSYISQTIIDGYQNGQVVVFVSGETMDAVLTGFTVANGYYSGDGGGILINSSSPMIANNIITDNTSGFRGGGVFITGDSSPIIINNIITQNTSEGHSGGMSFSSGTTTSLGIVKDCQILNNSASQNGGGLVVFGSNIDVINCIIRGNTSNGNGGGIYILSNAYANIINCTITANTAVDGGGIAFLGSDIIMFNSIVEGNFATQGSGVYFGLEENVDFRCCDFFNGLNNFGGYVPTGLGDISGFNIYGTSCDEFYNILEDPLLAGTAEHSYSLSEDSPCIDAGVQDTTGLNLPLLDIIGNERIVDGRGDGFSFIDMGAYEFDPDTSSVDLYDIPVADIQLRNYPNPFNPETIISFYLTAKDANLEIFNIKGQKIKSFESHPELVEGRHSIIWNGTDESNRPVPSGIYFYKLQAGDQELTRKMVLLK